MPWCSKKAPRDTDKGCAVGGGCGAKGGGASHLATGAGCWAAVVGRQGSSGLDSVLGCGQCPPSLGDQVPLPALLLGRHLHLKIQSLGWESANEFSVLPF